MNIKVEKLTVPFFFVANKEWKKELSKQERRRIEFYGLEIMKL